MVKRRKSAESTITGIVIPAEWGDNDEVIKVFIQTSDEDEYIVDQNKKGEELLEFIEQEVEVTGVVKEDEDGNFIIKINEYSLK